MHTFGVAATFTATPRRPDGVSRSKHRTFARVSPIDVANAADLNAQIKGLTRKDFEEKTKFFIETKIVPAMDELNAAMNDPAHPWHKRAIDAIKIIPAVGGAYMTGGTAAALAKALTATAAQFFVEVAAKGDKEEALKRSGLTYLLQLKAFHDRRS